MLSWYYRFFMHRRHEGTHGSALAHSGTQVEPRKLQNFYFLHYANDPTFRFSLILSALMVYREGMIRQVITAVTL